MKTKLITFILFALLGTKHLSAISAFSMSIYKDLVKLHASFGEKIRWDEEKGNDDELLESFGVIDLSNGKEFREFDFPTFFGVYSVSLLRYVHGEEFIVIIDDGKVMVYRCTETDQIWAVRRLFKIKENHPDLLQDYNLETIIKNMVKPPHFRLADREKKTIGVLHLHFHKESQSSAPHWW